MKSTQKSKNNKNISQDAIRTEAELAQGQAAFERIQPRMTALDDEELATGNVNIAAGALAALGVATRVAEPEIRAQFERLDPSQFDMAHLDDLGDLAWATLHASRLADQARYLLHRARLPADLREQATETRVRMQACCEYHLDEHPEAAPELTRLRAGQGHHDMANDLLGYAALYKTHQPLLETDRRHYRATDHDDAIRLGEQILTILGNSYTEEVRSCTDQLMRAWTLLLRSYNEVSETGRWLFRHDAALAERIFPSLFAAGRSGRSRRRDDDIPADQPGDLPADQPSTEPTDLAALRS